MQKAVILTEEEYEDLLKVQSKPDIMLRETNTQLKTKLDECQKQLQQGAFDNSRVDTPFIVNPDSSSLCFRSPTDFIIMWNSLAQSSLTGSDEALFEEMKHISELFTYGLQFASAKEVKAYRVNLQKKKIITGRVTSNKKHKLLTTKDN